MNWLRLVSEESYLMKVEEYMSTALRVPDARGKMTVVVGKDEDYHRDKGHRFGPRRLSKLPGGPTDEPTHLQ